MALPLLLLLFAMYKGRRGGTFFVCLSGSVSAASAKNFYALSRLLAVVHRVVIKF